MHTVFGKSGNISGNAFDILTHSEISSKEEALYAAMLAQAQRRKSKSTGKQTHQPLIDIVNPQPKAFFAYLNMPPKKTVHNTPPRVSRRRTKKG